MGIVEILMWVFGTTGISLLVNIVTIKSTRRKAAADAHGAEISNQAQITKGYEILLEKATQQYAQDIKRFKEDLESRYNEIASLKREVNKINKKMNRIMEENNFLRLVSNQAYKCKYDFRECPVITLRQDVISKIKEEDNDEGEE